MKEKLIFNWSGGKDSTLGLHKIQESQQYDILCLLTTISEQYQRISMHGVRVDLLHIQAESLGLPLLKVQLPDMPTMESYERMMTETLESLKQQGATASVFGDIFLEDLRVYRENKLALMNLKGIFPLWKIPTSELIHEFIDLGYKTIITCVDEKHLDKSFAGRIIDKDFLKDLPPSVDPCGENGEFHTFVFDGPIFKKAVPFERGEVVYRKYTQPVQQNNSDDTHNNVNPFNTGFWYCDLIPSKIVHPD